MEQPQTQTQTTAQAKPDVITNDIKALLRDHNGGELSAEIDQALTDVLAGIAATRGQKTGEVTIKLKLAPLNNDPNTILLFDKVTTKIPEPEKTGSIYFRTRNNALSRKNERQLPLFEE